MKIPQVQNIGVQSLQSNLSETQDYQSMGQSFRQMTQDIGGEVENALIRKNKAQQTQAKLELANDMTQFEADHANITEYDPEELDSEIVAKIPENRLFEKVYDPETKQMVTRKRMLTPAEVYPHLYERQVSQLMEAKVQKIDNVAFQEEWTNSMKMASQEHIKRAHIQAAEAARDDINESLILETQRAYQMGNYEVARDIVNGMDVMDDTRKKLHLEVNVAEESNGYEESMAEGDVSTMKQQLEFLRPEGYEKRGDLDDKTRNSYIRALNAEIARQEANDSARSKAQIDMTERFIKKATKVNNSGTWSSSEQLRKIEELIETTDGLDPEVVFEFEQSKETWTHVQRMSQLNPSSRTDYINALESSYREKGADYWDLDRIDVLRRESEEMSRLQRDMPMEFAKRFGEPLNPINTKDSELPEDQRLGHRLAKRAMASEVQAKKTGFTGIFTKDEAAGLYSELKNANSVNQKLSLFNEMLGDGSEGHGLGYEGMMAGLQEIFGQNADTVKDPMFVAAEVYAFGNPELAEQILRGAQRSDTMPEYKGAPLKRVNVEDAIGRDILSQHPQKRARLIQATMYALLEEASVNPNFNLTTDKISAKFAQTAGNITQINGANVVVDKDITQKQVDNFMSTTNWAEYLTNMSPLDPRNNPVEIAARIEDGDLVFVNVDHKKVALKEANPKDPFRPQYVKDKDDNLFTFELDMMHPYRKASKTRRRSRRKS